MDGVLGQGVGRGRLGAEHHGHGPGRGVPLLDLEILPDGVQGVHLLALVLVQPLDLDVQDAVGVDIRPPAPQPAGQRPLVLLLHGQQPLQEGAVLLVLQQVFQQPGVPLPLRPDGLGNQAGQGGIAAHQPPAEGDAVGLVVELFGIEHIEGVQLGVFQNLRVQLRHAVDLGAAVDIHMGHVDDVVFVPDGRPRIVAALPGPLIQGPDEGQKLGSHLLQIGGGPLLQGLGQDGVVGVGAGALHQIHGLLQLHPPGGEQPEQLGDHHGGVGVVDVYHGILVQLQRGVAGLLQLPQQQLRAGGNHEILLVDPQQPAGLVAVVGVQEGGQVPGDVGFVKPDAVSGGRRGPLHVEQVQPVAYAVLIAGDLQVVLSGVQGKAPKVHLVGHSGVQQPGLRREPGVGLLGLPAGVQPLAEQAVVVVEAHPIPVEAQRGDGIQKTGSQTAQTAVAQRGLRLLVLHLGQGAAVGGQQPLRLLQQAQVDQIGPQQTAHQKFRGEVIQLPLSPGVVHGLLQLTHRGGQGVHQLPVGAGVQVDPAGGQNTFQISLGPHTASPPFSSGRRSYSSICRRTRRASAGLSKSGSARHCQFPPKVEGVFIRPSEPRPSRSCI